MECDLLMDFTWRGESASSKGIITTKLPPIVTAARRDEPHQIPFRSGSLHIQDGAYEEILKPVSIYLPYEQGVTVADLREIRSWLTGYGWATFDNDPGRKYVGHIVSEVSFDEWMNGFDDREAQVIFECEPYAYHTNAAAFDVTQAGTVIRNQGTAEALPVLAVTGSGDCAIMIGSDIIYLIGISGTVYIDSVAEECYSMSGQTRVNRNGQMAGEFPKIPVGTSQIAWTGSITK